MIRLFFLLPILMCLIWWVILNSKGFTVKDGLKGFIYILSFNGVIIAFLLMMMFITN